MRIIGGHDYYDSAMGYGQDMSVVFVRHPRFMTDLNITVPKKTLNISRQKDGNRFENIINQYSRRGQYMRTPLDHLTRHGVTLANVVPFTIIVCGKIHYGIMFVENEPRSRFLTDYKITHVYDEGQATAKLQEYGLIVHMTDKRFRWRDENDVLLSEFFQTVDVTSECIQQKITLAIPRTAFHDPEKVFIGQPKETKWIVNSPNLGDIEFHKKFDAWSMFQELSMWIGGVMPRDGAAMVQITDDKIKIAKHGFDRWSFRKHKDDVS